MDVFIVRPDGTKVNAVAIAFPDGGTLPDINDYVFAAAHGEMAKVRTRVWTKLAGIITVYVITEATSQTSDSFIVGGS